MHSPSNFTAKLRSLFLKKYSTQGDDYRNSYERLAATDLNNDDRKPRRSKRGCLAVYVGKEGKRYEVPVEYLSMRSFQEMILRFKLDNLDTKIEGPLKLSCSTTFFEEQLGKVARH